MLKKVKLDIESHITELDEFGLITSEVETSRATHDGVLIFFNDEVSLSYHEKNENGEVFCKIIVRDNSVTVQRRGAIVSTMVFEKDRTFNTVYEIPPFKFDMEIKTKSIINSLLSKESFLGIVYEMRVGGAGKLAKMNITACEVKNKQ